VEKSQKSTSLGRREFLRKGALTGLGAALFPLTVAARPRGQSKVEVRRYVPLGHTGIKISDISFGSSRLDAGEESIVLRAFDRGINYFDTAESYSGSDSETTIGNALRGKRDKFYIASKVVTGSTERKESMMEALEGSLRRLRTDYVDIKCFIAPFYGSSPKVVYQGLFHFTFKLA